MKIKEEKIAASSAPQYETKPEIKPEKDANSMLFEILRRKVDEQARAPSLKRKTDINLIHKVPKKQLQRGSTQGAANDNSEENSEQKSQISKYGFERTPPRYWDIDFPTKDEQQEQGLIIEAGSPLFKKRKRTFGSTPR